MILICFTKLNSLCEVTNIVTKQLLFPLFYESSSFTLVGILVRNLDMLLFADIFELFQQANLIEKWSPTYSINKGI